MAGSARDGWTAPGEFCCQVGADADRVWSALTDPGLTQRYLYGLAAHSSWTPDAPIELRFEDRTRLAGRVLCVRPGRRLSYLVYSAEEDNPVYVTWLIRPNAAGCVVRLQIDEVEVDGADAADDIEDTWLPVLAALQRVLADSS
jgi:uncharacterized protein YndB with AHSA1/START domain